MSYIIDDSVLNVVSTKKWIDAGITSGLELSIRVETSENGNPFIELSYTLPDGRKVTRTEWEVKPLPPFDKLSPKMQGVMNKMVESNKNDAKTIEEASALYTKQAKDSQARRLISVARLYTPIEQLRGFETDSYLEFITFLGNSIKDKCEGVKLRVKLVYNHRGFVDTPDYVRAGDPWIEREDETPEEKSLIKINPTKDRMTRPEPQGTRAPKKENPLQDDFSAPASPSPEKTNDLPF